MSSFKFNLNIKVLILFFISILKLNACFQLVSRRDGGDNTRTEFPFADAKVNYHRSRYCITAFGQTNCVRMNEEPGNAAKVAKLYKIMLENYKGSSNLRMGDNNPAEPREDKPKQSKYVKSHKLIQNVQPDEVSLFMNSKPRKNLEVDTSKSVLIKPQTMNQQQTIKLSREIKPVIRVPYVKKGKQSVKLSKLNTKPPKWHVATVQPVAPVPRRRGYDKHGFLRLNYNPLRRSENTQAIKQQG